MIGRVLILNGDVLDGRFIEAGIWSEVDGNDDDEGTSRRLCVDVAVSRAVVVVVGDEMSPDAREEEEEGRSDGGDPSAIWWAPTRVR